MTLAPGLHDLPVPEYFADPCPAPSLSQSLAKILLEKTPLHLWRAHPRLGGGEVEAPHTARDHGSLAHELLLGKGAGVVAVDAADWRTKAAQAARAEALADGQTPALAHMVEAAQRMVEAARFFLAGYAAEGRGHERAFAPGDGLAEHALVWQEPCRTWCRGLVDWVRVEEDRVVVHDYKTTTASIAPEALARRAFDMGWHIQDAFLRRGLSAIFPGREIEVYFVVQEQGEPWSIEVLDLDQEAQAFAARRAATAIARFRECLAAGAWPAWPPATITIEMNPWEEKRAEERALFDAFARRRLGKHRGKRWSEPPPDYLEWVTRQQDMDADVRHAARTELARRRGDGGRR